MISTLNPAGSHRTRASCPEDTARRRRGAASRCGECTGVVFEVGGGRVLFGVACVSGGVGVQRCGTAADAPVQEP
eukprot:2390882-Rhodomonas_salina.1